MDGLSILVSTVDEGSYGRYRDNPFRSPEGRPSLSQADGHFHFPFQLDAFSSSTINAFHRNADMGELRL